MESTPFDSAVPEIVDHLFRHRAGQVVSTLTRIFGPRHLQLAEDVVQETMIKALRQWTYHGLPENPDAWIMRVAKNQALDVLRREKALAERHEQIAQDLKSSLSDSANPDALDDGLRDDQLRMIFMCCHPANAREAQVALTLKTVGGFGVPEIARAFLASEPTIAQRLVRAKRTLRERNISFDLPPRPQLAERLQAVLDVLYALFNEGYSAHQGEDLIRHELCGEAIRLIALLGDHPTGDHPRVHALLALMLLQASRLPARTNRAGDLLILDEQDRGLWDLSMVHAGMRELVRSARGDELTEYHLQAEIAACHALADSYGGTDWERILRLYDALLRMRPSPVVRLNRAVALAMAHGMDAGLAELREIEGLPSMAPHYLLHATRGELYRRQGNYTDAALAYNRAASLATNEIERRFLCRRAAESRAIL